MARKSQNLNSNFKLRPFQDDDYGGLVALRNIIEPDHPKSVDQMRHSDKTHKDKIRQKRWVWEKNGDIAVSALYTQFFEAYHPQKFALFIHVHPDLQGQGYGSASYDHLMQEIKPFDPIKITTEVRENHPRGIRFMEERGFTNTMKEQESRLDLNAYDPSQYQNEVDRVLDQGFRIVTLTELRREDERLIIGPGHWNGRWLLTCPGRIPSPYPNLTITRLIFSNIPASIPIRGFWY